MKRKKSKDIKKRKGEKNKWRGMSEFRTAAEYILAAPPERLVTSGHLFDLKVRQQTLMLKRLATLDSLEQQKLKITESVPLVFDIAPNKIYILFDNKTELDNVKKQVRHNHPDAKITAYKKTEENIEKIFNLANKELDILIENMERQTKKEQTKFAG